ncbi:MAG TPA: hypothetical protein VMH92_09075 [Acidocella sp.]|nr:hypothetical protein [Acidocella sp.]HUM08375.1 hypothetical protein [Acidocella sp.]
MPAGPGAVHELLSLCQSLPGAEVMLFGGLAPVRHELAGLLLL